MKAAKTSSAATGYSAFSRMIDSVGDCFTPEAARRLLTLKADAGLQARVDYLSERNRQGLITPEEYVECGDYVSFSTFIAILKSQSRQSLANSQGE